MTNENLTPGEAIRAAMAVRGWNQDDLARILGTFRPEVSNLVAGKRGISPEMAVRLAAALGGTPERWLGLDAARQLAMTPADVAAGVARRALVYDRAPVKEMQKRGWITESADVTAIESELCLFYEVPSLAQEPV